MAKLILYSDQLIDGNRKVDNELLNLLNKKNPSIAYIPSCSDLSRKYFKPKVKYYNALGIKKTQYFDLDLEYDESKVHDILKFDAIHLSGGNTFYFLHLLKKRGFIELLQSYVNNGGILIGVSAGSILTTKTIEIAGYGDDSDENFIEIEDKSALGLVDFEFMPHWDGTIKSLNLVRSYVEHKNKVVYVCKDGDGIIVDENNVKIIGNVIKIK
ncbi:Type 1 glutamine amidotransferase-like domain-containing protein (plasmid) [Clostridium estertheticum]|uniref:Type 1 glutamine amidotransferase-like domain-containing protein n=1 Tax=Clostridium estertheticum TaxID=238834 RepID=UPI001C7CA01D|nr:Type 1 glutamine amidotransferase-like domain-containing protein [Clostridium estertheticum]MBX4260405.1 Type 1 glutamine amidotransferase-like domain-containing protein [Clostridium estertheticum]WLC73013.1 Type 1 glutamine amidotransferase-like domain-containing protein [Clostridium estertheticum]